MLFFFVASWDYSVLFTIFEIIPLTKWYKVWVLYISPVTVFIWSVLDFFSPNEYLKQENNKTLKQ